MFAALALSVGDDIVDGPLSSLADWLRACAFASIAIAVLDEGLRAAQQIRARWPQVGILVLSQHVQARYAVELLAAGTEGVGYLLKDRVSDLAELSASVRRVGSGGSALDPAVVAQLVGQRRKADTPLEELTERELDVLALMAEGRSNKAIGERLYDDAAMTGSRP
jgi:DNA-binding NarL/FixJ family response regulator